MKRPMTVVYVAAQEDEPLRRRLERHLGLLEQQGLMQGWHIQQIPAGSVEAEGRNAALQKASLVLLLISADFFASSVCQEQTQRALERQRRGEMQVIPILLRRVDGKGALFSHLQALPTNGKPIASWANEDEALAEVAEGIRRVIEGVPLPMVEETKEEGRDRIGQGQSSARSMQKSRKNILMVSIALLALLIGSGSVFWIISALSTIANTTCAAMPTLIAPIDGQMLTSRTVTLNWEAPRGCTPDGYTVRVNPDYDTEAKPWIVDTGWAPTDYTYTFSADGTYYWHIRACKPCTPFQPGGWITRSFTIHTSSTLIGVATSSSIATASPTPRSNPWTLLPRKSYASQSLLNAVPALAGMRYLLIGVMFQNTSSEEQTLNAKSLEVEDAAGRIYNEVGNNGIISVPAGGSTGYVGSYFEVPAAEGCFHMTVSDGSGGRIGDWTVGDTC